MGRHLITSISAFSELLAQIGIPSGDDILKGYATYLLRIIVWGAVVIVTLTVLVVGLFQIRRRRGRAMVFYGAGVAAILAYIAFVCAVPPHHSVVLDLSSSRTPPAGSWHPNGLGGEMITYQGRVDLLLKLPDGRMFDDRANLLVLDRQNKQIGRVFISTPGMPLEQACAMTQKYLNAWGFDRKNFEQWRADRQAGKRALLGEDTLFFSYQNFTHPSLALELRGLKDLWTLQLTVYWPREEVSATSPE